MLEEESNTMANKEIYDELKVFKDCTMEEFEDIFGSACNTELPLYVNLFKFREQVAFSTIVLAKSTQYLVPFVIIANTLRYYQLKRTMVGQTIYFNSIGRTIGLALFFSYFARTKYATPLVREYYHVNINKLFDQDEPFLYENNHFKALVRRIHEKHSNLINPNFEIDEEILVKDEKYDNWYLGEEKKSAKDKQRW